MSTDYQAWQEQEREERERAMTPPMNNQTETPTPRTDAACGFVDEDNCFLRHSDNKPYVEVDFARTLERELGEAKEANSTLFRGWTRLKEFILGESPTEMFRLVDNKEKKKCVEVIMGYLTSLWNENSTLRQQLSEALAAKDKAEAAAAELRNLLGRIAPDDFTLNSGVGPKEIRRLLVNYEAGTNWLSPEKRKELEEHNAQLLDKLATAAVSNKTTLTAMRKREKLLVEALKSARNVCANVDAMYGTQSCKQIDEALSTIGEK